MALLAQEALLTQIRFKVDDLRRPFRGLLGHDTRQLTQIQLPIRRFEAPILWALKVAHFVAKNQIKQTRFEMDDLKQPSRIFLNATLVN